MRVSPKKLVLILLALFVVSYGLFQARDFLSGPRIYLESPHEGEIFQKSLLVVKGTARDASRLNLNGRPIFTDAAGKFEEEVVLARGVNVIELAAEDKFGHKARVARTLLME